MKNVTSYNFGGQIWRYQGFYVAFILSLVTLAIPIIEPKYMGSYSGFITLIVACILWGTINLWLQPIVKTHDDGILIIRLGLIRRKISWGNIKLYKKIRTITRYSLIGLDPRYAIIEIKDATIFDKYIAIIPFFNEYDDFISNIETKINKNA